MLGWCKNCIGKKEASSDTSVIVVEEDTSIDKVALLETKNEETKVILEEPTNNKNLDKVEEDSGTCVDASNSSAEMLDIIDKAQLTISSVNSILPDLPEQDDVIDENNIEDQEIKPLLPKIINGSRFFFLRFFFANLLLLNIPESETPKSKTSSRNVFTDIDILQ